MPLLRIASLVVFSLSTAAFAADQSAPPSSVSQPTAALPAPVLPEKQICRKTPEIGSLIKMKKQCATRAEWKRIDAGARDITRDMQGAGGSSTNQ